MLPIFTDILTLSEHTEHEDLESIDEFFKEALKFGTEGLMIKDLDSDYICSKRSWDWVKLKKDYIDGVGDTLDLVPIGAYYGSGKRKVFMAVTYWLFTIKICKYMKQSVKSEQDSVMKS